MLNCKLIIKGKTCWLLIEKNVIAGKLLWYKKKNFRNCYYTTIISFKVVSETASRHHWLIVFLIQHALQGIYSLCAFILYKAIIQLLNQVCFSIPYISILAQQVALTCHSSRVRGLIASLLFCLCGVFFV